MKNNISSRLATNLFTSFLGATAMVGMDYVYARRYDEGGEYFRQMLALEPEHPLAYNGLGLVYGLKGMYREAIEAYEKSIAREQLNTAAIYAHLGYMYAKVGEREKAWNVLHKLDELRQQGHGDFGSSSVVYAALDENDQAFAYLEKSVEAHEWWGFALKVNPLYDSLRSDPRYPTLLRRVGL